MSNIHFNHFKSNVGNIYEAMLLDQNQQRPNVCRKTTWETILVYCTTVRSMMGKPGCGWLWWLCEKYSCCLRQLGPLLFICKVWLRVLPRLSKTGPLGVTPVVFPCFLGAGRPGAPLLGWSYRHCFDREGRPRIFLGPPGAVRVGAPRTFLVYLYL